ncbi:MAG: ion channel [Myxococcota bacterium]
MRYAGLRERYGFWGLLLSLSLAFTTGPFLTSAVHPVSVFLVCALLLSVIVVGNNKLKLIFGASLVFPVVISVLLMPTASSAGMLIFFYGANASFFVYVIFFLFRYLFSAPNVTTNTLLASLSIYFALAIVWGMLYGLLEVFYPGSFKLGLEQGSNPKINDLLYFSVVTLTTLGYGDISPLSPQAKTVAATEALVGQIYLTVLVARLVGLHIAESSTEREAAKRS